MEYKCEIRALIVEDDPDLLSLMESALEQIQVQSISTQSAEAALAVMLTRGREVGIVISDICLSGVMDGIDFAREVRTRWPELPFVITSGNPGGRLMHQPANIVFLPKPWQISDFIKAAQSALNTRRNRSRPH